MNSRLLIGITFAILAISSLPAAEIPTWGTFTSPRGDVPFTVKDDRLELKLTGSEHPHSLKSERLSMDAPRVLRPISGDFTIQVKVDGALDPGQVSTEPTVPASKESGLIAMLDDKNYVTLLRTAFQQGTRAMAFANFTIRVDGRVAQINTGRVRPLKLDEPAYLKLARQSGKFLGWVSNDGENWDALEPKDIPADWKPELQAGILATSNARTDFAAGFSGLKWGEPAAGTQTITIAPPENPFSYLPSNDAGDCEECKRNLEKIAGAIAAYRKDNKDIPNWLSDLVPKYLPDTSALICPVTKKTDRLSPFGALDPKVRCSYLYEFPPTLMTLVVKSAFEGPLRTTRDWKRQQMGILGSEVPIVRCLLHTPALNLSYGGRIFESPVIWEQNFLDVTDMKSLSPR
jgi:hypothetical protein